MIYLIDLIDRPLGLKTLVLTPIILVLVAAATFGQIKKAIVTINTNQTFKNIEGFGLQLSSFSDTSLLFQDTTVYQLFTKNNGLSIVGFTIPQHLEDKNDDDNANHFTWSNFRMISLENQMIAAQKLKKVGIKKIFAISNTIPAFAQTIPHQTEKAPLRADKYDEYAEHLAAYVIACKKNWGIDIFAIGLDHQSGNTETGFGLNPHQIREALRAIKKRFDKEKIKTQLFLADQFNSHTNSFSYSDVILKDSLITTSLNFILAQGPSSFDEPEKRNPVLPNNKDIWALGYVPAKDSWEESIATAINIHQNLSSLNISSWINELKLGEDKNKEGVTASPVNDGLRHFSKYINPGATRINASSNIPGMLTSAFIHPTEGVLTIVIVNANSLPAETIFTFNKGRTPSTFQVTESTVTTKFVEKTYKYRRKRKLVIPAKSIVTVSGSFQGLKQKDEDEAATVWNVPEEAKLETWGSFAPIVEKQEVLKEVITRGSYKDIQNYLKKSKISSTSTSGWTALHWAVYAGRYDITDLLLKRKANINKADTEGVTALHIASSMGFKPENKHSEYQIFKLLLTKKPIQSPTKKEHFTPLHLAVINAYVLDTENEAVARIKDLIKSKADLEANDYEGRTPLHWAAWQGYAIRKDSLWISDEVVQLLLSSGSKVNASDITGRTPLHYATQMGHYKIIEALLEAGADTTLKDNWGKTPYDIAMERGLSDLAEALMNEFEDDIDE